MTRTFGSGTFGAGTFGGAPLTGVARVAVVVGAAGGPVDVSCDWRSASITRGRSSYLDAFAAGAAQITLYNPDGTYSPWSPDSLWNVDGFLTSVPLSVAVTIDGSPFPLFTGSTDRVADTWPGFVDAVATIDATDGFKQLARYRSTTAAAPPVERSGARIGRLLDLAGWAGPRRLDVGVVNVAAQDFTSAAVADLARSVDEAEWGAWFVEADGAALFRQRDAVSTDPRLSTVQAWFVDEHDPAKPKALCYSDLRLTADDDRIVNLATVQRAAKPDVSDTDAESTAHFGPRSLTLAGSLIVEDAEALGLAQLIILLESSDDLRVEAVTFDADTPAAAAVAARLRLLDRIGVVRHLPGGFVLEAELLVEGMHHDLTPLGENREIGRWTVTLSTSTALAVSGFGRWDDSTWDDVQWGV